MSMDAASESLADARPLRMRITAAAESAVRAGHPWIFSESIREQNRDGQAGELAVIYDRNDRFLAIGLYDPFSPLRVRVLQTRKPAPIDAAWWQRRLLEASARRDGLFDSQTTGYRCINGESDGWPGLVLDRYGDVLVLKLYTAAWLPRIRELSGLFLEYFQKTAGCRSLVLRLSRNIQQAASERWQAMDGQLLAGLQTPETVVFLETGLRLEANVVRGQKTGFFLDQRENRRRVEQLSAGRKVLNAFSFSGAFSLYAARGGAVSVLDMDISAHALAAAQRNFALNRDIRAVCECQHETLQADVFDWLAENHDRKFDLIILDPPSLAKRESERSGAIQAYERLAGLGIRHLAEGGLLVAASCSAHVSAEEFFSAVRSAAGRSRRQYRELSTTGHAPDHPALFSEASYLKCIYLQF